MKGPVGKEEAAVVVRGDQALRKMAAPVKEIEKRLRRLVKVMDELLVRLYKQQDLGRFLVATVDEYRVEVPLEGKEKKGEVTLQDRLMALRCGVVSICFHNILLAS